MALVEITQSQGRVPVTVFHLRDRIHLENFAEFENLAKDAYDKGTRNLVIDLGQTNTFTSIGLRALVVVHKIFASDGSLKVAGATALIREIMQVAGISQFIDIHDTVDEAVASF